MHRTVCGVLAAIFLTVPAIALSPFPPPMVRGLSPAVGSSETVVRIRGENLLETDGTPPRVMFGDTAAKILSASSQEIVVAAPWFFARSSSGTTIVDVTLRTQWGAALHKNAFTYKVGFEDQYERVLLPIVAESPRAGVRGSLWKTELAILNGGADPIAFVAKPCWWLNGGDCHRESDVRVETLEGRKLLRSLPPLESSGVLSYPYHPVPQEGRFVYIDRERAGDVAISLRLHELSRGEDRGVDIPVARDADMRNRKAVLVAIPLEETSRAHLRIYADSMAGFLIRLTDQNSEIPQSIDISMYAFWNRFGVHFPQQPAYAEIPNLRELVRQSFGRDVSSVTIEVMPDGKGIGASAFWAFASVTHNATQDVMFVTPH